MPFNAAYQFKVSGRVVVLKHSHNGHIRVSPNSLGYADGAGGTGQFARWIVELTGDGHCKFRSTKTNKYLRIARNGKVLDVGGGGGPFTKFKIHYHQFPNGIKLESERFSGRYIAVKPNRTMKIGSGGRHCHLYVFREGGGSHVQPRVVVRPQVVMQPPMVNVVSSGAFNAAYMFRKNNTICIRSNYGKHLRVAPNNPSQCDGNGGQGKFARWRIELNTKGFGTCRIQSVHTGKRLRVDFGGSAVNAGGGSGKLVDFRYHLFQSPNGVKLESIHFTGRYVAIRPNGAVVPGTGGQHCKLFFLREGNQQVIQQPVIIQQQPVQQPTVIVQQPVQPQVIYQQQPVQQQQPVVVQQPVVQQQQPVQTTQNDIAMQQAQLSAQNSQSEVLRLQQEMASMKLAQQQQLAQQQADMEQQKQAMELQQQQIAQQQQQVLDAQNAILQQQNSQVFNPPVQQPVYVQPQQQPPIVSPQSTNEGFSSPYNPNAMPQPAVTSSGGYPVLNNQASPVQPVVVQQPVVQQPVPIIQPVQVSVPVPVPVPDQKNDQPLSNQDAVEVAEWLKSLKMSRYYDTFIENGYDQLEAVSEITKEDLKDMGVALGHIKIIMGAKTNALYANKEILIKSNRYQTFVSNYGPAKKKSDGGGLCEINHKKKRNDGCKWIFQPVDNKIFALKNVSTGCFLRIYPTQNKEVDGRYEKSTGEYGVHSQLILEKVNDNSNIFNIKAVSSGMYLSATKPRTLGKDELISKNTKGLEEQFQFLVLNKVNKQW